MKRRVVVLLPLVLVPRRAEAALALVRCNVNWLGGEDGAVAADVEEEEGRTPEDGACVESARREAAAARVAGLMIDLMVCFVVSLLCLVVVASGVDGLSSIERRRLLSLWLRVTGVRLKLGGGVYVVEEFHIPPGRGFHECFSMYLCNAFCAQHCVCHAMLMSSNQDS